MRARVVADPDGRDDRRRIADEPGVDVVVRRAGFAGCGPANGCARAGAVIDDAFEHIGHFIGFFFRHDLGLIFILIQGRFVFQDVAVAVQDLDDGNGFDVDASVGEGTVGAGHFQRRYAPGQAA